MEKEKPSVTIVISGDGHIGEYTLSEPKFNSFDEACDALKEFLNSYPR